VSGNRFAREALGYKEPNRWTSSTRCQFTAVLAGPTDSVEVHYWGQGAVWEIRVGKDQAGHPPAPAWVEQYSWQRSIFIQIKPEGELAQVTSALADLSKPLAADWLEIRFMPIGKRALRQGLNLVPAVNWSNRVFQAHIVQVRAA
jgi:hypothetical protein